MLLDESWFYFLFGLYRVTFYTREGVFLTTYVDAVDRDYRLVNGTEEAKAAIAALRWLDEADETEDEAFDVSTSQMVSLLEYADMFKPGDNTSCSMMIGGTHTLQALYTYLYHILPALFAGM